MALSQPGEAVGPAGGRGPRAALLVLVGLALLLRLCLALGCPIDMGYSWDPYFQSAEVLNRTGRIPVADDCWECYQPPLFALLAAPFHAAGMAVTGDPRLAVTAICLLGLLCGALAAYFSVRILVLLGFRGSRLVLGCGLVLAFPCLVLGSWSAEADILLTAVMAAFLHELVRYRAEPRPAGRQAAVLGLLAGAALATKYSGLLALLTLAVVLGFDALARVDERRRLAAHGAVMLAIALAVGGWRYLENLLTRGTPFFANGQAQAAFHLGPRRLYWEKYRFASLELGPAIAAFSPERRRRQRKLTDLPVYASVWTTLHAQAWTDMTFFSLPGRGATTQVRRKEVPVPLVAALLVGGLLPAALAGIGLTRLRRAHAPLAVLAGLTLLVYFLWVLSQLRWAIKTKYILFLLPAYVAFALEGQVWLEARVPWLGRAAALGLAALVVLAHAYLFAFARA